MRHHVHNYKSKRIQEQGVRVEGVLLAVTPNDPLGDFVFLVPAFWTLQLLEVLAPPGGMLLPGDRTKILLKYKL